MTGGFSEAHYAAEEDVRLGESAQKRFLVSESRHSKVLAECANPEELSLIQVRLDDPNPDSNRPPPGRESATSCGLGRLASDSSLGLLPI